MPTKDRPMKEGTREGGRAFRLHYRTSVQGRIKEVGTESLCCNNSKKGHASSLRSPWSIIHQKSPGDNRSEPGDNRSEYPRCAQLLAGSSLRDAWPQHQYSRGPGGQQLGIWPHLLTCVMHMPQSRIPASVRWAQVLKEHRGGASNPDFQGEGGAFCSAVVKTDTGAEKRN